MSRTRILVVRNDKLGDFMLSWPAFALLKQLWPEAILLALVPHYTADMARMCPWIDEVILDEGDSALRLAHKLRASSITHMLTLFSTRRVALAGLLARIPYRLAPATKVAQIFYNQRLTQRRSRSEKPEYAYNLDLVYRLISDCHNTAIHSSQPDGEGDYLPATITRPLLQPSRHVDRREFSQRHSLDHSARWIVIHPGSGGSANNLALEQYARLAASITYPGNLNFLITAGPGEEAVAQQLCEQIQSTGKIAVPLPSATLSELVTTLQWADLHISGSTGPLHVAAAMNRPTATFYPRHRSATPLRWQTLNAPDRRLAFTPVDGAVAEEVQACDVDDAARQISQLLLRLYPVVQP